MSDINAITYPGGAATTPSNTTNDPAGPFAAIMNTAASASVTIQMVSGSQISIWMLQGVLYPFACVRINAGSSATVVGFHANPYKGNAQ